MNQSITTPIQPSEITIGLKFVKYGQKKREDIYKIVDIIDSVSRSTGKVISTEYLCSHEFMGQLLHSSHNVVTIQRSIMEYGIIN